MHSRKILYLNVITLIGIEACHYFIIKAGGRNDIWIDFVFLLLLLTLLLLNGYSIYLLFKSLDKFIILALFLSLIYYSSQFIFPLYSGTR